MPDHSVNALQRTEWIELSVADGTVMPAYIARPRGESAPRGMLVLQEAFGVNPHVRDVAERFAREGYTAIAPALFHRTDGSFEGAYTDFAPVMQHMQALTDEGQSADIRAAYDWMVSPSGGNASAVASVGYCMGGRTSFLANSLVPLKAAASYYGGGIASSGRPNFPDLTARSGELHAPMLLIWGGLDKHIDREQRGAVESALIATGKPYLQSVFSYADHGFFCDARESYNPDAADQAWALTTAFFRSYVVISERS